MKKQKLLTLVLSFVLLAAAVAGMTACGNSGTFTLTADPAKSYMFTRTSNADPEDPYTYEVYYIHITVTTTYKYGALVEKYLYADGVTFTESQVANSNLRHQQSYSIRFYSEESVDASGLAQGAADSSATLYEPGTKSVYVEVSTSKTAHDEENPFQASYLSFAYGVFKKGNGHCSSAGLINPFGEYSTIKEWIQSGQSA